MSSTTIRAQIGKWKNATDAKIEGLARQVCFEMAERVVTKTPVDTGFLRGSWQPSIGEPQQASGVQDKAGAGALNAAAMVMSDVKAGDRFYMINNAKYARHVEYGTSKMAGRFYVSDTVKNWQAVVDQVAAELGLKK
ncbi:Bacteriophage HK97-gp10, putative tail-component [uncultured Caudovirales phage]|uniref:Bacteriophage HK97-gp10, putative tail-component n=1 Tax=uncultured Caudovirales phage TaxID=2100421 RepID=A0A6J5KND2_9CAUD|nr:Bacteriophage HK97-gp10, putative tail-component [uncultured Caudovirales phage]CAB4123806.1 Bacteriophage HK97-gp10, putative tail-component [uncultured Caudovirales phage]